MKAGIVGASGYLGAELLRLLAAHRTSRSLPPRPTARRGDGRRALPEPRPPPTPDLCSRRRLDPAALAGCDVVFVAVPSGRSQEIVPQLSASVPLVVDLGGGLPPPGPAAYPLWYGFEHTGSRAARPVRLRPARALPRRARRRARSSPRRAATSPPPRSRSRPSSRRGSIEPSGIIVDAASGTSGAGRRTVGGDAPSRRSTRTSPPTGCSTIATRPRSSRRSGPQVLFTPHLAPMTRGILATCYARPTTPTLDRRSCSAAARARPTRTSRSSRSSDALPVDAGDLRLEHGPSSRRATTSGPGTSSLLAALDNLVKGGAGQAIQAANVALGLRRDDRAAPGRRWCRERHRRRAGFVAVGHRGRHQGRRARSTSRSSPSTRRAGAGRGDVHDESGLRPRRCRSAGPTSPTSGGPSAAVVLNSGCANAATGAAGLAARRARRATLRRARARRRRRAGPRLLDRARSACRCRSSAIDGGRRRRSSPRSGEARRRRRRGGAGDPDDRHQDQGGRHRGDGFSSAGWRRAPAMIAPNMATMLAVLTTDALVVPGGAAARAASPRSQRSFNEMTVDGCTSTNDTVIVLASGAAGRGRCKRARPTRSPSACADLAVQMVADAEGATKVVRVRVVGARRRRRRAGSPPARSPSSQLVKGSWYGADPYWGRIVTELGSSGAAVRPRPGLGRLRPRDRLPRRRRRPITTRRRSRRTWRPSRVEITCDLGLGAARPRCSPPTSATATSTRT